jgi:hypothetical protein
MKNRRTERFSTASSVFLFFLIIYMLSESIVFFILGIVIGILLLLFWPFLQRRSFRSRQISELGESRNHALLGRRVLQLEEDTITERSELIWSKIKLSAIDKAISTSTHTILVLSPKTFIVIPHAKITQGDLESFSTALREKLSPAIQR